MCSVIWVLANSGNGVKSALDWVIYIYFTGRLNLEMRVMCRMHLEINFRLCVAHAFQQLHVRYESAPIGCMVWCNTVLKQDVV